jgi:hypothetical protein
MCIPPGKILGTPLAGKYVICVKIQILDPDPDQEHWLKQKEKLSPSNKKRRKGNENKNTGILLEI